MLVAGGAGLFAYRSFKAGAPPTPELAIEEAKRVKETSRPSPRARSEAPRRRSGQRAMSDKTDVYVTGAGEPVARAARVPGERSSDEIRHDIELARVELGHSVEASAAASKSSPTGAARSASISAS